MISAACNHLICPLIARFTTRGGYSSIPASSLPGGKAHSNLFLNGPDRSHANLTGHFTY